ncbi:hypothetical protein ACKWTF_007111 [Chironomus riparius]
MLNNVFVITEDPIIIKFSSPNKTVNIWTDFHHIYRANVSFLAYTLICLLTLESESDLRTGSIFLVASTEICCNSKVAISVDPLGK